MHYSEEELVRVAKRENNKKRSYLVVDPLQGKHIPVSPKKALSLFDDLAKTVGEKYHEDKLLVIGFAETATAIGAEVAFSLKSPYIQTTREQIPNVDYLFFSEEHSHATEQKLVKDDIDPVIATVDRVVFVEDEVTTGNTILNIIRILEARYPDCPPFAVASILNGMDEDALSSYQQKGIDIFYLLKTDHSKFAELAEKYSINGTYCDCTEENGSVIPELRVNGCIDTRRLTDPNEYQEGCSALSQAIRNRIGELNQQSIVVIGTEECMYPALFTGRELEQSGNTVKCHSTTRSPIAVSRESSYPVHTRYKLRSLYDEERITFLYDIASYDYVIIITDAPDIESMGIRNLAAALQKYNTQILLTRWCK